MISDTIQQPDFNLPRHPSVHCCLGITTSTYLESHLLHCVSVANVQPLQNVLNAAARIILRKRKFDHITTDVRVRLHWLLVQQRIEYKVYVLVYKCLHQAAPTYLAGVLT